MGGEVCREEMGGNVEVDVVVVADETDDGGEVKVDDIEDTGAGRIESSN